MADFVQTTVNKTAVRDLAVPIADVTSFNNLVQSVIDDNPFGCVGYTGSDGQPVAAVVRNREHGPDLTGVNTPCGPSRSSRSSQF